jgi:uncharacterized protein (TIGR01777 family)
MQKVLITGGSGLIGSHLTPYLEKKNIGVSILTRKSGNGNPNSFQWNVGKQQIDANALKGVDTIVHLAGAGVDEGRWTKKFKQTILDSRVKSAELLFNTLKNSSHSVKTFVSASGVGYYGDNGDAWVDEMFRSREDFFGEVCSQWEKAARDFEQLGIRVVILRTGVVLTKDGGALPKLAQTAKFFVAAPLGSGEQYVSWIHLEDLCRMYEFAITNQKLHGTFNAVAPRPVTNKMLMSDIASVLNRPVWPFTVPSFLLKLLFGEKASIVLEGQRVSSEKIRLAGFEFNYSDLKQSLEQIYS